MLGGKNNIKKSSKSSKIRPCGMSTLWPCSGLKQSSQQKYLLVNQYTPSPPWSKGKNIFKILFIQNTKQNKTKTTKYTRNISNEKRINLPVAFPCNTIKK